MEAVKKRAPRFSAAMMSDAMKSASVWAGHSEARGAPLSGRDILLFLAGYLGAHAPAVSDGFKKLADEVKS